MQHKDAYILEDIITNCEQIEQTVARFGDSFETFSRDLVYQNSCAFCLFQIGESVNVLSDEFRNSHKDMAWREIIGLRNLLAHEYGHVDVSSLWKTIQELKDYCKKTLF